MTVPRAPVDAPPDFTTGDDLGAENPESSYRSADQGLTRSASSRLRVRAFAHAKLNLRLKVTGRRDDGFHLLSMLNVPLSLHDEVEVTCSDVPGVRIEVSGDVDAALRKELIDSHRNLAGRAAQMALPHLEVPGLLLRLEKRIPAGGGLGGGSSDAAAVLRACAVIAGRALPLSAAALGADVPYFLQPAPAVVRGIGEVIEPLALPALLPCDVLLVLPPFGLATPQVYATLRECMPNADGRDDAAIAALQRGERLGQSREALLSLLENDLVAPATRLRPELGAMLERLCGLSWARAGMTGSGSTLFVLPRLGRTIEEDQYAELRSLVEMDGWRLLRSELVANQKTVEVLS